MFPELMERAKAFAGRFDSSPVTLDLKAGGVGIDWYARNGFNRIYSTLMNTGMPAWSGETVSLTTAQNHSVVWACNRVISGPVGLLPLSLMQRTAKGKRIAYEQPLYSLLHDAPNDESTAQVFRETLNSHCLYQGNAYSRVVRRSGTGKAIELRMLLPQQVMPDREREGQKRVVYVVSSTGQADKTFTIEAGKPQEILHVRGPGYDGLVGYSVLTVARQSIGTALATSRNVAEFFAHGGRVPYLLTRDGNFKTDEDFEKFRANWEAVYSKAHRAPILEGGMKYQQIGLNMEDSQMLGMMQFNIPELCRWFKVSPHLVGDLSRATFSNIEQLALEFISFTLSDWTTRWEQELSRCVLTPEERGQGYYFKFDFRPLLRGDMKSRFEAYSIALQNGFLNQNEVRDDEDLNPFEGGDEYHVQLNMGTLDKDGQLQAPKSLVRLGAAKESA